VVSRHVAVVVTLKRYDAPAYTYTHEPKVRRGRAEKVVLDAAYDAGENITRGWKHPADIRHHGHRATIRSGGVRGYVRAVQSDTPPS
jgi:hypothetical protein